MLFFGIENKKFRLIVAAIFAGLTLIFLSLAFWSYYYGDPYQLAPVGRESRLHNEEGDFPAFAAVMAIEFLILAAVLVPYAFSRFYWLRLLLLQFLFFGWLGLNIYTMMPSGSRHGGVMGFHALYLVAINIIIFILMLASVVAEIAGRRKASAQNDGTTAAA